MIYDSFLPLHILFFFLSHGTHGFFHQALHYFCSDGNVIILIGVLFFFVVVLSASISFTTDMSDISSKKKLLLTVTGTSAIVLLSSSLHQHMARHLRDAVY